MFSMLQRVSGVTGFISSVSAFPSGNVLQLIKLKLILSHFCLSVPCRFVHVVFFISVSLFLIWFWGFYWQRFVTEPELVSCTAYLICAPPSDVGKSSLLLRFADQSFSGELSGYSRYSYLICPDASAAAAAAASNGFKNV